MTEVDQHQDWHVGYRLPKARGLYDPDQERDACGLAFIADLTGNHTHKTVRDALTILARLQHRGACGCDENAGDGAGIMISMPDSFFRQEAGLAKISLPEAGHYGAGNFFMPKRFDSIQETCEGIARKCGLEVFWWRQVPTNNSRLGAAPLSSEPEIQQCFIRKLDIVKMALPFDAALYLFRKGVQNFFGNNSPVYICSLSSKTIVYKGQLTPEQLSSYFPDLSNPNLTAKLAMVHSRYSTNTFPSWERAQPLRTMCHNGEINTLRGNCNWMTAREGSMQGGIFGNDLRSLYPVVEENVSDSGAFDNVLEFLHLAASRPLPDCVAIMLPESWQKNCTMPPEVRAMHEFYSYLMEPWDGPAVVAFSDGDVVGAVLDRNGLRPGRFCITADQKVICASEVGVIDVDPSSIISKGNLEPGKVFMVDLCKQRIVDDAQFKQDMSMRRPYSSWIARQSLRLSEIDVCEDDVNKEISLGDDGQNLVPYLKAFGYTSETLDLLLAPMGLSGYEALGSMGTDVPLAVLSRNPKLPYEYFKQMFAQVTNPPIDPIRESIITSLRCPVGAEGNIILPDYEASAQGLVLDSPVLQPREMAALRTLTGCWQSTVIDCTMETSCNGGSLHENILRIQSAAETAVRSGLRLLILSDDKVSDIRAPICSLLSIGAVHQHLIYHHLRSSVCLVADAGDCSQTHQFCCLIGFGADAIFPRIAYCAMCNKLGHKKSSDSLVKNFQVAVNRGIAKVMAKMGVSTLQGYKGAQLFEAIGIHKEVMQVCFRGAPSRIGGVGFDYIEQDTRTLHCSGFGKIRDTFLDAPGEFHWRSLHAAELHINHPDAIVALQQACQSNDQAAFTKFTSLANKLVESVTIRGLLKLQTDGRACIDLDQVEPAKNIVKRFCTGAMSFGSLSREAHTSLAKAMHSIGGRSNTGEGGEEPNRLGTDARSATKQVASGRFGVNIAYLSDADEIQIKMAQGAKPGEGGELPGHKVTKAIAETRHSTPGVGLISPPPHHDVYSIEDLAQLIYDLKCSNPSARISVKLVSEVGVGVVASGVAKGKADHILISGHDGGTGASTWTGIKHAGIPWELGLSETHQTLVQNGLRSRVILQTDGQLRTGLDVVKAAMLGAEEFGFATAPLIVLGCLMMRKCHLNTCPVGIATQDPVLRAKFKGQPEHVVNYLFLVAEDVRVILASLGFERLEQIIGRCDLLQMNQDCHNFSKTRTLDLSCILTPAVAFGSFDTVHRNTVAQKHDFSKCLDLQIISQLQVAEPNSQFAAEFIIQNTHRSVGARLSNFVYQNYAKHQIHDGVIDVRFMGSAGQSFGAFLAKGIRFDLEGDANDYVGKGLSGGCIIVKAPRDSKFRPELNTIVGNVGLYGATSGKVFIAGRAASRLCVRNSGGTCVVEGAGDHCCEYMTGGTVVCLGDTGRNFGAGMTGGIAFVYALNGIPTFQSKCNLETIDLLPVVEGSDIRLLRDLISEHHLVSGSLLAKSVLDNWHECISKFIKIFPKDFQQALADNKAQIEGLKKVINDHSEGNSHKSTSKVSGIKPEFLKFKRKTSFDYRDVSTRVSDFEELLVDSADANMLKTQVSRCMDCGVPFCHQKTTGCPLGNRIPEFNSLIVKNDWEAALQILLSTNPFPEFTGRVCPAPCEASCVLGIIEEPVTIKNVELAIIEKAFKAGHIQAVQPSFRTGKIISVIGSGPAGLAVAHRLNRVYGHSVRVFERSKLIGGLLMYGVPNMKLDKIKVLQRRVDLLKAEGVRFYSGTAIGSPGAPSLNSLREESDAVVLAIGSTLPRELPIPGRALKGVHCAMDFLSFIATARAEGTDISGHRFDCAGRRVLVIGGGDTGNDCIGVAVRYGSKSVTNFELLPQPENQRSEDNPWPQWPRIFRVDYGHQEVKAVHGHDPRHFCILSKRFISDSAGESVAGVQTVRVEWKENINTATGERRWTFSEIPGTEKIFKADIVLLAMGFVGPESNCFGVNIDKRGNIDAEYGTFSTKSEDVFACGDCRRGQSLVVWAIAEGQYCADKVDQFLSSR